MSPPQTSPPSSSRLNLARIPPELLLQIFKLQKKQKDRLSMSGVCKQFRRLFAPMIFRRLTLHYSSSHRQALKPGYTHCKLHGWYDGTEPPCHGDLNKGTRPICLERYTPYNHCGYFSSGTDANRGTEWSFWTPARLRLREPATAPLAAPLALFEDLVIFVEPASQAKTGPEIPFILYHDSTPKLKRVRLLAHIGAANNEYAKHDSTQDAVALFKTVCAACTERNIELHIAIELFYGMEIDTHGPLQVVKSLSGLTSLAFRARCSYSFGVQYEYEVTQLVSRFSALDKAAEEKVGGNDWQPDLFHIGPKQDRWVRRNAGKYSPFLTSYKAASERSIWTTS